MGLTYVEGQARGPEGQEGTVSFLVDSGAVYSLLPHEVWQSLSLQATRGERFILADGTVVSRDISFFIWLFHKGKVTLR